MCINIYIYTCLFRIIIRAHVYELATMKSAFTDTKNTNIYKYRRRVRIYTHAHTHRRVESASRNASCSCGGELLITVWKLMCVVQVQCGPPAQRKGHRLVYMYTRTHTSRVKNTFLHKGHTFKSYINHYLWVCVYMYSSSVPWPIDVINKG